LASRRGSHQLPPGRHGLSREFVLRNQRERLLSAVADVTSAGGYPDMSVEDVIALAGVSRRTFYEHFRNKEDVFLAAHDAVTARVAERVAAAVEREDTFAGRCAAALRAFVGFVAAEPAAARMWMVEALAAGPAALERRDRAMQAVTARVEEWAGELPAAHLTAETVVGGVHEVVYSRLLRGETAELPSLLRELTYSVLLPYLGPRRAREAA
jgi:AcrR family transcriptional regulator